MDKKYVIYMFDQNHLAKDNSSFSDELVSRICLREVKIYSPKFSNNFDSIEEAEEYMAENFDDYGNYTILPVYMKAI